MLAPARMHAQVSGPLYEDQPYEWFVFHARWLDVMQDAFRDAQHSLQIYICLRRQVHLHW